MAGCNEGCHCYVQGADGLQTDGLGTPDDPYEIGVENGYAIARAMTEAQRLALTASDLVLGQYVLETDTGITWVYQGATYGWRHVTPMLREQAFTAVTLSAGVGVRQTLADINVAPGVWMLHAKAYLDVSIDIGAGWGGFIRDLTAGADVDQCDTAVSGGEHGGAAGEQHWRTIALQAKVAPTVVTNYALQVHRSTTNGTQVARYPRISALLITGEREF